MSASPSTSVSPFSSLPPFHLSLPTIYLSALPHPSLSFPPISPFTDLGFDCIFISVQHLGTLGWWSKYCLRLIWTFWSKQYFIQKYINNTKTLHTQSLYVAFMGKERPRYTDTVCADKHRPPWKDQNDDDAEHLDTWMIFIPYLTTVTNCTYSFKRISNFR